MAKTPAKSTGKKQTAKPSATQSGFVKTINQILPLQVTDGKNQTYVSVAHSENISRFMEDSEKAKPINLSDKSLFSLPLSSLEQSDVIIPRGNRPVRISLTMGEIIKLLSTRIVSALDRKWSIQVGSDAIHRMISGKKATVIGKSNQNVAILEVGLADSVQENLAAAPIVDEILVRRKDLAKFLHAPLLPGTRKQIYRISFTEGEYFDLVDSGAVSVQVNKDKTLSIVVVTDDTTEVQSGLSFRRDIWSPIKIETTFGVMSKGDMSSLQTIEAASSEAFDTLIERMRANIDRVSSQSVRYIHDQVVLVLPWKQVWNPKGLMQGTCAKSVSLAPKQKVTSDDFAYDSEAFSVSGLVDELLLESQKFTKTNVSGFTNLTSPLVLNLQDKQEYVDVSNLATKQQSFTGYLNGLINNSQFLVGDAGSIQSGELKNTSTSDVLELNYHQAINRFAVEMFCESKDARLGLLMENPYSQLHFDANTVLRYREAIFSELLVSELVEGFDGLGQMQDPVNIRPLSPYTAKHKQLGRGEDEASHTKTIDPVPSVELLKLQREALYEQVKTSLILVQKYCKRLLDKENEQGACFAIASIGDENAASQLKVNKGDTRLEDAMKCRLWLARVLYEKKFPHVFSAVKDMAKVNTSDLNVGQWGERFCAAIPTKYDMLDLINLANESLGEINNIFYPLISPLIQLPAEAEPFWRRIDNLGLSTPHDGGLARLIERLVNSHNRLQRFDAGDFDAITEDNSEAEDALLAWDNDNSAEMARQLVRHVQAKSEHYAAAIFSYESKTRQASILQAVIDQNMVGIAIEAFDFDQIWVCGNNVIVALHEDMVPGASKLLTNIRSTKANNSNQVVDVPVSGHTLSAEWHKVK